MNPMKLKGADIIVETLIEMGTDVIFGYPGGSVLNIYDSLYKNSGRIRHVLTSHEQHAGHAADGYARATGKVGVCLATSGPGATNLVTALANANMDSIPLVAITGNVETKLIGLDSFQEVDITGITMPVTKHNFLVKDVSVLADTIRKAFAIANSGRRGPVLIDVPKDVTAAECEYLPKNVGFKPKSQADIHYKEQIKAAIDLIKNSNKPFIYTGGGVISSGAGTELAAFARAADAPVSSSLMGQGCFDQRDARYLGMLGMHGTVAASAALQRCDLLIALGTRFSDRVIGDAKIFSAHTKVIHADIDPAEHGKNILPDVEIIGDIKQVLAELNKNIPQKNNGDWCPELAEKRRENHVHQIPSADFPVTPQMIIEELDRQTEGRAVVTTEVGQHQMWASLYYEYREPRGFISSGGLGTMGFGLGAAIGASIGRPEKKVINIAGDGSFGMNMGELLTLSRNQIPIIQLIMNNGVLGMVRQWQRLFYEQRYSGTILGYPVDYGKLAEAFGIAAFVIEKPDDIAPVLKSALSLSAPVLVDCRISPDMNVLPMVPAGRDITKPLLEL